MLGGIDSGIEGRPSHGRRGAGLVCVGLALFLWLFSLAPSGADLPRRVLIIHSGDSARPSGLLVDGAIRQQFRNRLPAGANIFTEFLDADRFSGPGHEERMEGYLREKYADKAPDVLISTGPEALEFLLRHRSSLFET